MLARHKKSVAFLIAIAAGAIFGLVHYAEADELCDPPTFVEGPGAQDTNGDGIATIAEGEFDLDEDGKFTCVEAEHFGMDCFICWQANCEDKDPVLETLADHLCMTNCNTGKKRCYSDFPGETCEKTASGCN